MKRLLKYLVIAVTLALLPVLIPGAHVLIASWGRVGAISSVEYRPVAIVLGARATLDGPADMLKTRLDLGARLYRQGTVNTILVTGDGRSARNNEPEKMKRYLADEWGVPAEAIVEDPRGYDTYDSCRRASSVYGVESAIVVTHDYHVRRTITLCEAMGINTLGIADGQTRRTMPERWWNSAVREPLANLKMEWDLLSGMFLPREG